MGALGARAIAAGEDGEWRGANLYTESEIVVQVVPHLSKYSKRLPGDRGPEALGDVSLTLAFSGEANALRSLLS